MRSCTVQDGAVDQDDEGVQDDEVEISGHSCSRCFSNFCDPAFFKSVINVGEIFCPLTCRKVMWWGGMSLALGGVIAAEVLTGAFSTAASYNSIGIMAAIYAVDPVVQLINIVTAKYPPALTPEPVPVENSQPVEIATAVVQNEYTVITVDDDNFITIPSPRAISSDPLSGDDHSEVMRPAVENFIPIPLGVDNSKVAVVIPTHLAADKIEKTIRSILRHVKPCQIYILDNGNSEQPLDNTREIVRGISTEIKYYWGHVGNKTFAQYIGSIVAEGYDYIYTSDDDMRMSQQFRFGTELINDKVKAVCYPIVAIHPEEGKTSVWTRWQSLEYKMSDCAKLSQARFGGVLYPHGAASLWDRKVFLEILKLHDGIFYCEDVKLGMLLQKLGYQMAMAAGCCLETEAPTSLFGVAPNLYMQRVRSWEMGRQIYFHKFVLQLFTVPPPSKNPVDAVFFKLAEAYAVYSNIIDWFRLPVFALMLTKPEYWIRFSIFIGWMNIPLLLWNYIKLPLNHRTDLQSGIVDILTFPVFKLIESAMAIGGIARCLSIYAPNYKHKPTVAEIEQGMLQDRAGLIQAINNEKVHVDNPPMTYKKVMYARFFQPAIDQEDIEREFDANVYEVYQEAVIEALGEAIHSSRVERPAKSAMDALDEEFVSSAVNCNSLPVRQMRMK